MQAIGELLGQDVVERNIALRPDQGRLRARLYARGAVHREDVNADGEVSLAIRLPRADLDRLLQDEGLGPLAGG